MTLTVYIWNNLHLKDWPWTEVDRRLGGLVSSIWVQFAKSGNPNGPGLPAWPKYSSENPILFEISGSPKSGPPPFAEQLQVVHKILARDWR